MRTITDITGLLDVHGYPPTSAQIAELRRKHARSNALGEDSVSGKIMLYSPPVMGFDLVASLVVAAVEACLPDPVGDLLKDDDNATARDWGDGVACRYVDKVRSLGRPLIAAEVGMLSSHRAVESQVTTAVSAFRSAILT